MRLAWPPPTTETEVMIVDPAPADYEDAVTACAGSNCSFRFARDGHDALRLWRSSNRAVWVVHVDLPDMDGFELAELLRSQGAGRICLIDESYDPRAEIRGRMCGASMYLCKPLNWRWLLPAGPPAAPLPVSA